MRHRKGFNHLSRKVGHRRAMLGNMASSLIKHKRIETTTAKAKALRSYVEPLITKAKNDTTHSRRTVFKHLQDKEAVSELFREVATKVMERPGGYTRIIKLGSRLGDSAEMAIIELVDYNPNLVSDTGTKKSGSRRRRRGSGKSKPTSDQPEAKTADSGSEETKLEENQQVKSETPETQTEDSKNAETPETSASEAEIKEKENEPKEENITDDEELKAKTQTPDKAETESSEPDSIKAEVPKTEKSKEESKPEEGKEDKNKS